MKRAITTKQEEILRACHHDFDGLTQAEAAQRLGVSQSVISNALGQIEKVLPQFFPILTKLEAKCYHHFAIEGWNVSEIAQHLSQSENAIYKVLKRAKNKGAWSAKPKDRILSYNSKMDANVKKQF